MLKYKYRPIFQIKYTESILSNSIRELLWFEITKVLIGVREKIIVIYYNFWHTFVPSRTLQWALLHHCYRRHLCSAVGLLDTSAGPAKTAELIEMPSGWELVGMDGSQHTQSDSRGDSTRRCGLLATVTVATCYISVFLETLCTV